MFANKYLLKNNNETLIPSAPESGLGIIVVIPCYREPDVVQTLQSLKTCSLPLAKVEVIILINHSEIASNEIKDFNKDTKTNLDKWIDDNNTDGLRYYAVGPVALKKKWAGAGLARKKGMDEAVRRFSLLEKPDGIVVSLDADTLVENNYLCAIEKHFSDYPKNIGATLAFEHQKKDLDTKQEKGIRLYENYLNYYKCALDFTGYPYSMFTIGSAFAVKALAYVKRGGMNRRQAGEDFYFLQNLVQMGTVGEITTTKVYPSARLSDRVPFGTGPILQKWMTGEEDLTQTYNFDAFVDLKKLFAFRDLFYKIEETEFISTLNQLPESISRFIQHDKFWEELADLNRNCSTLQSFQTRFYQKFNAFKILKYLNFSHENFYQKADLNLQLIYLKKEM